MSGYRGKNEERSIPVRLPEEAIRTLERWKAEGHWPTRGAMLRSMIMEIIRDTEKSDADGTR